MAKKNYKDVPIEERPVNRRGSALLYKGMPPLPGAGRPKGSSSVKTQIQEGFLAMMKVEVENPLNKGKKEAFFNVFNEVFAKDALRPNSQAFKFIAERLYGMGILDDIDNQVNRARREDSDFAHYRVYRMAFDIQQTVLLSQSRDIGLMAGRRAGKSETVKLMNIDKTLDQNKRCLIIGLTIEKTKQIYWDDIVRMLNELGVDIKLDYTNSIINFGNGSLIMFGGNSNKIEREKYRGQYWDLITIDECQSQPMLGMFIQEIINPMLLDTNGKLVLAGSGPRTRGTYWEKFYLNPSPSGLRLNWDLSKNPHIYDYQNALATEREKHALTETDPLYMREYLGLIVYDDNALVFRLSEENKYNDDELTKWMASQSPEDIRFVGGLDFGFRDSDAFVVLMYSEKSNEKFIVYEYKQNNTDVTTLCDAIKAGKDFIKNNERFSHIYNRDFDIFADTSDQKISMELSHRYGIPVHNAVKYDKAMAIQNLQDDVRKKNFKVKTGSIFEDEALRIIFKRIEIEGQPSIITREIDDEIYHPDMMDAILYALRYYWLTHNQDHKEVKQVGPIAQPMDNFIEMNSKRNSQLY